MDLLVHDEKIKTLQREFRDLKGELRELKPTINLVAVIHTDVQWLKRANRRLTGLALTIIGALVIAGIVAIISRYGVVGG